MNRILASFSVVAVVAASVSAQCFNPAGGSSITGSLIQFTGADPVHDEGRSPLTSLGFVFPMPGGLTFTDCVIETNGLIYLANGANPVFLGNYAYGSLANLAGAVGTGPRLAPFWRDNQAMPTGWDITTSSVPGVSFTVNWINTTNFAATSPARSFSATLYATGVVEYAYDSFTITASFVGLSVGNNVGAAAAVSNLAGNPTGGTTGLIYETFATAASWDLSNKTMRFTPNGLGGWDVSTSCAVVPSSHTSYGAGCYSTSDSFYQTFANAAAAAPVLSNQAITFTPTGGNGYVVTAGGTFLPVGSVQATPTIVANGDDTQTTVPFTVGSFPGSTGLSVCSNGWVALAAGNNTTWNVTAALMLNDPARSFRSSHDMNPTIAGSGNIKYEESASVTLITYDGVWDFGGTSAADANTIQFQFYPSGVVTLVWGTLSPIGASGIGYVVGFSPAGPSQDGGSQNLMGSLPYVHAPLSAMSLSATPNPVSTATTGTLVTYTQNNIPEAAPASGVYLGATMISLGQDLAGTDLSFLGMPGCALHITSFDLLNAFVGNTNSLTTQFQIPAGVPSGFQLFAQSVALVVPGTGPGQNAFGATLSNGLASFISTL